MAEIQLKEISEALADDIVACVKEADLEYMKSINDVADALEQKGAKIVLLSGPSSSGKTTTANILKDHLAERGHKTVIVSLDNFYRDKDDPGYPKDDNGMQDYEAVESLHIDKIRDCLKKLLSGEDVSIPRYVFEEGRAQQAAIPINLPENGLVIMEGLHALNPVITEGLDSSHIIKMFISVSTNINEGKRRILSGRKIRFIRRMTRDSLYRGSSAAATLARWSSVLAGEDKYLYPFKETADFRINTFHKYELAVMKPFAEKAISDSESELFGEYIEIIKSALAKFRAADISNVPQTSLIREFIPGGKYESQY
ncbi:MAG: hypothetical protein IJZ89_06165 [Clostridia bacterium]|nr:hypothetical protein [Clostridia bacterium]